MKGINVGKIYRLIAELVNVVIGAPLISVSSPLTERQVFGS